MLAPLAFIAAGAIGGGSVSSPSGGADSVPTAFFDFNPSLGSGPARLPTTQSGMSLVVDCDARDQAGTTLVCDTGGLWAQVTGYGGGGGTTVSTFAAPFTESTARSINYFRAVHAAPDTTTAEITTEDIVGVIVFRAINSGATQYVFNKYDLSGTLGRAIRISSGGVIQLVVNATSVGTYTLPSTQQWNIIGWSCKRDGSSGSLRLYVNGVAAGTGVCPAATMAAPTKKAQIGGRSDAVADEISDGMVALVREWKCTGCLTTTAAADEIARQHAHKLMGIAAATAADAVPLKSTRAGPAYLDIIRDGEIGATTRFFYVGDNWMRVSTRYADSLDGRRLTGYLSEPARQNMLLQNSVFGTTWTDLTVADSVTSNDVRGPNDQFNADRIVAALDVVGVKHGMKQSVTLLASQAYVFSAVTGYVAGDSTPVMWLEDETTANAYSFFDIARCKVGTNFGNGLYDMGVANLNEAGARRAYDLGTQGGYQWCLSEITIDGTAAPHSLAIGFADVDGTFAHTTTASERVGLLWYAQLEQNENALLHAPSTSMVPTTTVAVTRAADELTFDDANWPTAGGQIYASTLQRKTGLSSGTESYAVARNASGLGCTIEQDGLTDYIFFAQTGEAQSATQYGFVADIEVGNVAQVAALYPTGKRNFRNGEPHFSRAIAKTNDVRLYIDGEATSSITDTSVTLPVFTSGYVSIGYSDMTNFEWTMGLVMRCRIDTTEWEVPAP